MKDTGPILVPLDGSELAEAAVPYASGLARGLNAPIVLVTAWEGTDSELGAEFPSMALEIEQKARMRFTDYFDGVKKRLHGQNVETMIRSGEAAQEILHAIEETRARLLVIATHGRSGISRWVYGSTAGHLLRESPVPVLAVGPHTLKKAAKDVALKHIMTPLDGSDVGEEALPVARQLAQKLDARLSLVRVVEWAVQAYPYALPDQYAPQVDEELDAGAKAYLKRKQEELKDVQSDAFVVRGAVADGLIEFEEKESVDLTVMTTHAREGLARLVLGSVADRMLQGPVPVLMVRPEIAKK